MLQCLPGSLLVVPEDLNELLRVSNAMLRTEPGTRIFEPVSFKFNPINVLICFQYAADLGQFINIPSAYFHAVRQREPFDCPQFSETIVFKDCIEFFEHLRTPNMTRFNMPNVCSSCEVRILERSYGEVWRSTRRMVVCTSIAETHPRCVVEFFMPMSRVQIKREESSRELLMKWSDTTQERSDKTNGNYSPLFSNVYDGSSPNVGLSLQFRSESDAEEFEKAILSLSMDPIFSWNQTSSAGHVYDVVDPGLNQKRYKAILLLRKNLSYRYCDVFYLYRDVDYVYEHLSLRVRFPKVYYADYVSTHVDQLYAADRPVSFSHCEKRVGSMTVDFNDESVLRSFMTSLSPSYELLYSRCAHWLMTKTSLLKPSKLPKGNAEVQLWRKGNAFQLACRWVDNTGKVVDKWLTMAVSSGMVNPVRDSNRLAFPNSQYSQGTVVDLVNIIARNSKPRQGAITIAFKTVRGVFPSLTHLLILFPLRVFVTLLTKLLV